MTELLVEIEFLEYDLTMPATVLYPGESMTLTFGLNTAAVVLQLNSSAVADFADSVQIGVTVPPGYDPADLVPNSILPVQFVAVPETQITTALAVGIVLLAGGGSNSPRRPGTAKDT